MKKILMTILSVILAAAVLSSYGCKKANSTTITLTVLVSAGVSGIPETGYYTLAYGYPFAYRFTLDPGYSKLTVLLDDAEIASSGTISLSGDHTLQAYADDNIQYALTVTMADGVSGSPAGGTFSHGKGSPVSYSYALKEGYSDLVVTLDGEDVAASGTITMSGDHALSTHATAKKNIQGSWLLTETYDDGSSFEVTAAFSGSYTAGTVTDSDGGSGTYTVAGDAADFTLVFPDVGYTYDGDFSDADTMSGTCTRFQSADNVISGTWTATRSTATAAAKPAPMSVSSKKGKG